MSETEIALSKKNSLQPHRISVLQTQILQSLNQIPLLKLQDDQMLESVKHYQELYNQNTLQNEANLSVNHLHFKQLIEKLQIEKQAKIQKLNQIKLQINDEITPISEQSQFSEKKDEQLISIAKKIEEQQEQQYHLIKLQNEMNVDLKQSHKTIREVEKHLQVKNKNIKSQQLINRNLSEAKQVKSINEINYVSRSQAIKKYEAYIHEEEQQLLSIKQLENQKSEKSKQQIMKVINEKEKVDQNYETLLQDLENAKQEIKKLDDEIYLKFSQIQRCAEFLEELDDFDKLALIFIYDKPENFDLVDILNVIQVQLSKPKEQYQKQSLEEFVQRLRFNQVSIRMQLFIKFHNNNLNSVINQLIIVFKDLLVAEETYNNRFHDLMQQKQTYKQKLLDQDDLIRIYVIQTILFEKQQQPLDDSEYEKLKEEDLKLRLINLDLQIKQYRNSNFQQDAFFLNFLGFNCQSLSRLLNIMYVIKEYLRTQYQTAYISRWIDNPIYDLIRNIQNYLAEKFAIQTITQRLSQQTWNQIYTNLKNDKRLKKNDQMKEIKLRNLTATYFTFLSKEEIDSIISFYMNDQVFSAFCDLKTIQRLYIQLQEHINTQKLKGSFETLFEQIHIQGRQFFLDVFYLKASKILQFVNEFILAIKIFKQKGQPKMSKKPTIRQLLDKHNSMINHQPLDKGEQIIMKRIEEIEIYKGLKKQDSISTEIQSEQFKIEQSQQEEPSYDYQSIKQEHFKNVHLEQIPIFNFLNSKHRINKKLMVHHREKIKTMATNLRIDECESPMLSNFKRKSQKKLSDKVNTVRSFQQLNIIPFQTQKTKQTVTSKTMTPISQKILSQGEFYKKQWTQQSNYVSSETMFQKRKNTSSLKAIYLNNQTFLQLMKIDKRKSVPEKMFTQPSYYQEDDNIEAKKQIKTQQNSDKKEFFSKH